MDRELKAFTKKEREETMRELLGTFVYYMTQRPPAPGAQPSGCLLIDDFGGKKYCPEIGMKAYARITYGRMLTEKEIYQYELIPGI